jgi:hypothetical protein
MTIIDGIAILKILTIVLLTLVFNSHQKKKPKQFRNYPKEQVLKLDSLKNTYGRFTQISQAPR